MGTTSGWTNGTWTSLLTYLTVKKMTKSAGMTGYSVTTTGTWTCPTVTLMTKSAGMTTTTVKMLSEHHPLSDLHQLVSERPCTSSPPASATAMSSGRARTPQVLSAGSLAKFLILL